MPSSPPAVSRRIPPRSPSVASSRGPSRNPAGDEHELCSQSTASAQVERRCRLPDCCFPVSKVRRDGEGTNAVSPDHSTRREIDVHVLLADGRTIGLADVSPEETVKHLIARIEQADPQRGFLVGPRGKMWATRDLRGNLLPDVRLVHLGATLRPNSPIEDVKMKHGALLKLIPGAAAFMDTPYVSRPEARRPWVPRASPELARRKPAWTPRRSARATPSPARSSPSPQDDAGAVGGPAAGAGSLPATPRSAPVGGRNTGPRYTTVSAVSRRGAVSGPSRGATPYVEPGS